jgi:hypothetical protein
MTIADFISIAAFRSTLTHRFRLTRLTRLTRLFPMQSSPASSPSSPGSVIFALSRAKISQNFFARNPKLPRLGW